MYSESWTSSSGTLKRKSNSTIEASLKPKDAVSISVTTLILKTQLTAAADAAHTEPPDTPRCSHRYPELARNTRPPSSGRPPLWPLLPGCRRSLRGCEFAVVQQTSWVSTGKQLQVIDAVCWLRTEVWDKLTDLYAEFPLWGGGYDLHGLRIETLL